MVSIKILHFWHGICSEKPYNIARKLFACTLKNPWYNVDIRSKEREKRDEQDQEGLLG